MSVVGIPNDKINDEAVEAGAEAIHDWEYSGQVTHVDCWHKRETDEGDLEMFDVWRQHSRAVLAAAVPYIEAEIRAKIAAEIEDIALTAQRGDSGHTYGMKWPMEIRREAARVARGTQETTK